ncbi:hypothetical protein ANN_22715 [Periplaneta americana]|uniref:HAT C-terminal dimerisation domain-containing protein n=1 Tax=Periplaneta americana TaxID=6978 RepID=A0ABQ8S8X1_PERAM|nr:hypothetical protein ANN_22715 [Periplaneta americana]
MSIFRKVECQLKQALGKVEEIVLKKLEMVLARNPGYSVLKCMSDILNVCDEDLPERFNSVTVSLFKHVPVTSRDVEIFFSAFKLILSNKRHKLTPQHLEMILVIYCAKDYGSDNASEVDA